MKIGIIGAGVIGLSTGFELADSGHDVTLFDAGRAGKAASAVNAGWVTPFLSTPRAAPGVVKDAVNGIRSRNSPVRFHLRPEIGFAGWGVRFLWSSSRRRSQRTTQALQEFASHAPGSFDSLLARGVKFQHHRDGLGVVFLDAQNLETYQEHTVKMRGLGYDGAISVYRGSDVQDFDPAISRGAAGVVYLEDERHVHPESFSEGLARAVTEHGGSLLENTPVKRIEPDRNGRWVVVSSTEQRWTFDRLIVSAGFHTRQLLLPLKIRLPLEAAKGVSITASGDGVLPKHPLKLSDRMVASSPFDGGLLRLSGTFDVGQRTGTVDQERLNMVVRDASRFFESWTPTTIESTGAGHRPTSADDTPIIGPVPGQEGLYVATGHGTLGVTLGPITGALVAREITTRRPEPLLAPFLPERFSLRF